VPDFICIFHILPDFCGNRVRILHFRVLPGTENVLQSVRQDVFFPVRQIGSSAYRDWVAPRTKKVFFRVHFAVFFRVQAGFAPGMMLFHTVLRFPRCSMYGFAYFRVRLCVAGRTQLRYFRYISAFLRVRLYIEAREQEIRVSKRTGAGGLRAVEFFHFHALSDTRKASEHF
jgi:hypothetical protein